MTKQNNTTTKPTNQMAKAILEFDLTDPDDARAHMRCVKATDMALVIWDIMHRMRKDCINVAVMQDKSSDYIEGINYTIEAIQEVINKYDINTDELIV